VHRAAWPRSEDLREAVADADPAVLDVVRSVLSEIRKAKSEQRRSQRSEVARLVVEDNAEQLAVLPVGERDLIRAGSVRELVLREATVRRVTVELVPATDEVPGNTFASERPRLSSSRTSAHTSSGQ
jgi:valyl-tRNA synthetase